MSATDAAIQKKIIGSGTAALIIANKEIEDVIKIVKSFKESVLLIKWINKTVENKAKQQKGGLLPVLLGTLTASLLRSALKGWGVISIDEGVIRAGQNFWCLLIF